MTESPPPRSFFELALAKYPENQRHKCLSCGFLAEAVDESTDVEVRSATRQLGRHFASGQVLRPFCFQNAQPIFEEYTKLLPTLATDATGNPSAFLLASAAVEVIAKDRNCAEWYPYSAGASPLWHREEMRMMHVEELRRQNDLKIAELQADSAERGLRTAEAVKGFTTKWTYIAAGLAALAIVFLILSWLFPNPLAKSVTNPPAIYAPANPRP